MQYVFGPVPSRRLGRSLGVDPIPLKTCNWNCVYCQLGRSVPLTPQRGEYAPAENIVEEVRSVLDATRPGDVDWITFVGSGEPTLHDRLGWMIRRVKEFTGIPVALITNGSLLYRPGIRNEILPADAVLPSLDAGTDSLFRSINRPHPEFTFSRLVDGLVEFRRMYKGKLWVEVMLVHRLNDSEQALRSLAGVLLRIQPDEVHLSLPLRPPAESWVRPARADALARAVQVLGSVARILPPIPEGVHLAEDRGSVDAVLEIITRHPLEENELIRALRRWGSTDVSRTLSALLISGRAQVVRRGARRFWSAAGVRYGKAVAPRTGTSEGRHTNPD
ncbi:MAG: radical SAM protein [Acidobacteria bacterium]|nr:radical SAM protein [Acidobacteriota bacterium]